MAQITLNVGDARGVAQRVLDYSNQLKAQGHIAAAFDCELISQRLWQEAEKAEENEKKIHIVS